MKQFAHHVERPDISAQVHHSDVSGQSSLTARIARSTGADTVVSASRYCIAADTWGSFFGEPDGSLAGFEKSQAPRSSSCLEEGPGRIVYSAGALDFERPFFGPLH